VRLGFRHGFLVPPRAVAARSPSLPLGIVVAVSFVTTDFLGSPICKWPFFGWHTSNYHTVFSSTFLPAFLRSTCLQWATTLACLPIG
jgi:ABC-type spermidine/putrescine transport system permease subunit I